MFSEWFLKVSYFNDKFLSWVLRKDDRWIMSEGKAFPFNSTSFIPSLHLMVEAHQSVERL